MAGGLCGADGLCGAGGLCSAVWFVSDGLDFFTTLPSCVFFDMVVQW